MNRGATGYGERTGPWPGAWMGVCSLLQPLLPLRPPLLTLLVLQAQAHSEGQGVCEEGHQERLTSTTHSPLLGLSLPPLLLLFPLGRGGESLFGEVLRDWGTHRSQHPS